MNTESGLNSTALFVLIVIMLVGLSIARALSQARKKATLPEAYGQKYFVRALLVIPVICGFVVYAFVLVFPQQRDYLPFVLIGTIILANLVVRPVSDPDKQTNGGPILGAGEASHTRLIILTVIVIVLAILSLVGFSQRWPLLGLVFAILAGLTATQISKRRNSGDTRRNST